MLLKPPSPKGKGEGTGREIATGRGNKFAGKPREDPAVVAMRAAGVIAPLKDSDEKSVAEQAKEAFENHGLNFDYVAEQTLAIVREAEPQHRLAAIKFVNDVITLDSETKLKELLEANKAPQINIQINNAFDEGS